MQNINWMTSCFLCTKNITTATNLNILDWEWISKKLSPIEMPLKNERYNSHVCSKMPLYSCSLGWSVCCSCIRLWLLDKKWVWNIKIIENHTWRVLRQQVHVHQEDSLHPWQGQRDFCPRSCLLAFRPGNDKVQRKSKVYKLKPS